MSGRRALSSESGDSVPVLDLGAWENSTASQQSEVALAVAKSLETMGFLLLRGHGVDPALAAELRDAARDFFSLPAEQKMRVHRITGGDPGYYPPATSRLAQSLGKSSPPDLKESFAIAPLVSHARDYPGDPEAERWFPSNRWPEQPAALRERFSAYFEAMTDLCNRLLRVFAVGLELPAGFFARFTAKHTSTAAVLHYPPQLTDPEPGQLRAGAHSDYGTLTVLAKEPGAQGLQVRTPDGQWRSITPAEGFLVVNIGDLLAEWTGGRWVSTLHRVLNPSREAARHGELSIPFFHQPDYDAVIHPMGRNATGPGVLAGRHLAAKVDSMHAVAAR